MNCERASAGEADADVFAAAAHVLDPVAGERRPKGTGILRDDDPG
jgi:hypothetical protein